MLNLLGGSEQTTRSILQTLVDYRHNVTLYTMTDSCIEIPDNVHIKKQKILFNTSWEILYNTHKLFKKTKSCDMIIISSGGLSFSESNKNTIL